MDDFARLAEALGPAVARALKADQGEARPRPDLHAEHERRLNAVEAKIERLLAALEKLVAIDERVTQIEHARLVDQGRAQGATFIFKHWPNIVALAGVGYVLLQSGALPG